MRVNPYIEPLLAVVTDLLNDPPAAPADLETRWERHGMPHQVDAGPEDLAAVRAYLRAWSEVVDADGERERVDRLNVLLRRYTVPPTITDHGGSDWHLHYRDPDAGFAETLTGATSAAAAQFLTDRGMQRLGRCALTECGRAFVDHSRPGRQRYCCHRCSNRAAVRRHRAR